MHRFLNAFFFLLAAGCLAAATGMPAFHDGEGYLTADYCLLISLVIASLLVVTGWRTRYREAATWFALFIFGQGIILQLIDAGTSIHYQHSRLINGIETINEAVLLVLLIFQAIAVAGGLRKKYKIIGLWINKRLGYTRALALFIMSVILSTFPSRELHLFAYELIITAVILATQVACLVLGALSLPARESSIFAARANRFLEQGKSTAGVDHLATGCAFWVVCIASVLSLLSYERHPHLADEVAYIYHANYFAEGMMGTPAPPVPEAFETYLVDCEGERCISPVPPGWPAVLAVGTLAGANWLVNPLLSGLNVILLFMLLQRLYGRYAARLGVLLVAAAPWYLLMSMNFMTHTFSLTCTLVAALSVMQMYKHHNSMWGIPGGIAIGLLSLTRPLEGLMVATVLGLAGLFIRGRRFRLAPVIVLASTSMIVGSIVLPYNEALTGDPLKFPIMAYADKALGAGINSLGFGPDKGVTWGGLDPFPGHGLPDVLVNAGLNLSAMNIEMFGWSIGSLLPIIIFLVLRPVRKIKYVDRWMLFFIAVIFGFQSLYWFSGGPDFGARYYYLAVIPLIALTVQALRELGHTVTRNDISPSMIPASILVGVLVLNIGALTNFLPWRAIDKYHHYLGMRPDIRTLISEKNLGADLLLINGKDHPDLNSALVYTSLDPYGNSPVIALDKNVAVRQRLLTAYPDRRVWLIDGPTRTGAGYRVTAGPLNSSDLRY